MNTTYITSKDLKEKFMFFKVHADLFLLSEYRHLSVEAKVLYSMMRSRAELSEKNGWTDENGRIYIFFTIEEIMRCFNCASAKAVKLLDELDSKKGAGLIERKKQGLGKPAKIFVKNLPVHQSGGFENKNPDCGEISDSKLLNCDNQNPELSVSANHDFQETKCNNTDINNNNLNNINNITSNHIITDTPEIIASSDKTDWIEERNMLRDIIKANIGYETAIKSYGERWVNQIVELMLEVICTQNKTVRINKQDYPTEIVRERFLNIDETHLENIYHTTCSTSSKVNNIRAYMITTIYRAYETTDSWIRAKANHDMRNGFS